MDPVEQGEEAIMAIGVDGKPGDDLLAQIPQARETKYE